MPSLLPRRFDLVSASLWASLWVLAMRPGFPEGRGWILVYLAAYFVVWLVLGGLARVAVGLIPLPGGRRDRWQDAASLGAQLAGVLFVGLTVRGGFSPWPAAGVALTAALGAGWVLVRRRPGLRSSRLGVALAVAAPLLVLGLGPGGGRGGSFASGGELLPGSHGVPVRLLALDGIDPRVLRRALEQGELPALGRIVQEGVSAPLRTISPHSPVIWSSLATGEPPGRHGVTDYSSVYLPGSSRLAPDHPLDFLGYHLGERLGLKVRRSVSSNARRAFALWDLLTRTDRSSLVVNWWASYPVDAIHGVMISNMAFPWTSLSDPEISRLEDQPHLVHPPGLQADVLKVVRRYQRTRGDELDRRFFRLEGNEFFSARDDVAFELYERFYDPSHVLASVYLHGIDVASHYFTELIFGPNVNEVREPKAERGKAAELWQELVGGAYRRMDRRVARALERLEPGAALVIVSDHGWDYDGTSHWNLPDGVFLAYGGPFASGVELPSMHLYDVFPTVAWALGLPVSEELPGRVVGEAYAPGFLERHPVATVSGYGERRSRITVSDLPSPDDAAHLERLRALGYLD